MNLLNFTNLCCLNDSKFLLKKDQFIIGIHYLSFAPLLWINGESSYIHSSLFKVTVFYIFQKL